MASQYGKWKGQTWNWRMTVCVWERDLGQNEEFGCVED